MSDRYRMDRVEVYSMIEEANLSIAGENESNRNDKIPQVLADFHVCIGKLSELQSTGRPFQDLSPREKAEAFIAAVSADMIISKVEASLSTDELTPQEIIAKCGVTEIFEEALAFFDPVMQPEAVHDNPYIEDRAVERIRHFYTDYSHDENDTIGVENYSCYLLQDEENEQNPDDPFRAESNPDYQTFLMVPNEQKLEAYRAYSDLAHPDPVDRTEPASQRDSEKAEPSELSGPAGTVPPQSDSIREPDIQNPDIFRFVSTVIRFPLEVLNSGEASDFVSRAQGEKGIARFEGAKHGFIAAVRNENTEDVARFGGLLQKQLDQCEKINGEPLELPNVRSDRIDRLEDLGNRAFMGTDGRLIRLNQTDPWRAWAVLKYDIGVLTTGKEEWEDRYHTEKPSAAGSAGRCVAGFLGLMHSLSGTGIFTAYASAVYKGLLDYADRMELNPDRDREVLRDTESRPISIEAVAKFSAMEIVQLLERPDSPEIQDLRSALGDERFSEFRAEVSAYLETNDSSRWEQAQTLLETASERRPDDLSQRSPDHRQDQSRDSAADLNGPSQEKYILRLRDIDARQGKHGDYSSLFSFDSNGNEYRASGMRWLDPRDTIESFRFMTSVVEAFAHGGRMDFQLPGRNVHEGKRVNILDVFMSVNQFLHTDIGYTIIKYAFENARDSFVDLRAADTRDLFEQIVSSIENGPEAPFDPVSREETDLPPSAPDHFSPSGQPENGFSATGIREEDYLAAASEDDTDIRPPEDTDSGKEASSVSSDSSEKEALPSDGEPAAPESAAPSENASSLSGVSIPESTPDTTEPAESVPPVSSDPPDAQADYTLISTEVKEEIAAYLSPDRDSLKTYEEIYQSLAEKFPEADYNHIDFAMDTAEVFSATVEEGTIFSADTAEGLFDNMYDLIMKNEPVNDGFSKSDLYDMTFREIADEHGDPVCSESMFLSREEAENENSNPGEPVRADDADYSTSLPLQDTEALSSPEALFPADVHTDEESTPSEVDIPDGSLMDYYTAALTDTDSSAQADPAVAAEAPPEIPASDISAPEYAESVEISAPSADTGEISFQSDVDIPEGTDIPAVSDSIPDTEIKLSESAAEEAPDVDAGSFSSEEASEVEDALSSLL